MTIFPSSSTHSTPSSASTSSSPPATVTTTTATSTLRITQLVNLQRQTESHRALVDHTESTRPRAAVMSWVLRVCATHHLSALTRDSACMILNSFFTAVLGQGDGHRLYDPVVVSHAAVIALTFGAKLHEVKRTLHLSSFQDFDVVMLKSFEAEMLHHLTSFVAPQVTPTTFVEELLDVWRPGPGLGTALKADLAAVADRLIGEFFTQPQAVLYVPSTIAIAALILAFSILQRDCADWLKAVPDVCLPMATATATATAATSEGLGKDVKFDVDSCLTAFGACDSLRVPSPVTPAAARAKRAAAAAASAAAAAAGTCGDASTPMAAHRSPKSVAVAVLSPVALHAAASPTMAHLTHEADVAQGPHGPPHRHVRAHGPPSGTDGVHGRELLDDEVVVVAGAGAKTVQLDAYDDLSHQVKRCGFGIRPPLAKRALRLDLLVPADAPPRVATIADIASADVADDDDDDDAAFAHARKRCKL